MNPSTRSQSSSGDWSRRQEGWLTGADIQSLNPEKIARAAITVEQNIRGINQVDQQGNTPLMLAAMQSNTEVMLALLWAGADVNFQKASDGATPLILAALNGNRVGVALLLGKGADANITTRNGNSAIGVARQRGHQEVEAILLRMNPSLR